MIKLILISLFLIFSLIGYTQPSTTNPPLQVTEEDGSPSTFPYKIKFTNTTVTDNGDGTASVTVTGGSGATSLTGLSDVGSAIISKGYILIADGTKFQSIALSGDATISSAGVIDLAVSSVGSAELSSTTVTSGTYTAATITVDADGRITAASSSGGSGATSLTGLSDVGSAGISTGRLLIADGTKFQSIALSGDATISSAGIIDLQANVVGSSELSSTTVSSGTYSYPTITIDADGRITAASSNSDAGATSLTGLSDVGSATKTAANLLIADGTKFQSIAMSSDVVITSAGVATIQANAVALGTDTTNNYVATIADAGNSTITVANSGSESAAVTLDAVNVNCTGCVNATQLASTTVSANTYARATITVDADGRITAASSNSDAGATSLTGLSDVGSATITASRLLIADGTKFQSIALSGDATINSAGVIDLQANVVGSSELSSTTVNSGTYSYPTITIDADGRITAASSNVSGATSLTGLSDVGTATATAARILIADGTKFQSIAMSGDIAITSAGVSSIGANKVTDAMMNDTICINLPVYSAKISGAFVTAVISGVDTATQGAQIDGGDGNWRLLFDPTTDEAAVWQWKLPSIWTTHSTFKVEYSMSSATSGTVEYEAAIMCASPDSSADVGTASFAAGATATETVPGTIGYPGELSITLTDDSCVAGDNIWFYLSTDANDGTNDTATGDREVINVEYCYNR